ncbi:MAG TPA: polyphosphate polymerase domain-containing protein [Candidatus Binatia bacterium]|nr:polyphosphate polymerase domain-containing protein [Candidatus Binatia bacterium]
MSALAAVNALPRMTPISLSELDAIAPLQARRDRKYLVPMADLEVEQLAFSARVLTIGDLQVFRYESVYFDTPERASYLGAARRRRHRFKIRTRSYLDSGRCLLEFKTRDGRGRTIKSRLDYPLAHRGELNATGRRFLSEQPVRHIALRPVLTTRYARSTLVLADAARVTIDIGLQAVANGRTVELVGMAVVETKSVGPPTAADRVLWAIGHRPIRVSKFCTTLAILEPDLPANKWTLALRAPWHVGGAPRVGVAHPESDGTPWLAPRPEMSTTRGQGEDRPTASAFPAMGYE